MSDRLSEIEERLAHEDAPCCDHRNTEYGNCTDCHNTGHAHAPYTEDEAKADLAALVKFAREVAALHVRRVEREGAGCRECGQIWPCPTAATVQRLGEGSS